jgi:hypothetical protein
MFEGLIMGHSSPRMWILLAAAAGVAAEPVQPAHAVQAGVVVEEVSDGSAGAKAGIRPDDALLAWERPANPPANRERAEGKIESVFDWMWVEMKQGAEPYESGR